MRCNTYSVQKKSHLDFKVRKDGRKVLTQIREDTLADMGRLAVDSGQMPITAFLPSVKFPDVSDARQMPCWCCHLREENMTT